MDIFKTYQETQNKTALLKAVQERFEIAKIHESIKPYLFGKVTVKGIFYIKSFQESFKSIFSYHQLFGKLGKGIFPAIPIGYDTYGVEFWLVLTNGKVISLHHDASFSEVAYGIKTGDCGYFVEEFSRRGSIFNIATLLEFQRLSLTLGSEDNADYEQNLFKITAQSLGKSHQWLSNNIWSLPLEPIFTRARNFLESGGLKNLIHSEAPEQ